MRRQTNDGAVHPVSLPDNSARTDSFCSDTDELTHHPDDIIIAKSILSAANHAKHTISIWDVTPDGGFALRYANPHYLKINGLTEEVIGKKLEDIYPVKTVCLVRQALLDCMDNLREANFMHDRLDGRMLSMRILPQTEHGRVSRLICSGMDITEYVQEQNRLKAEGKQLEHQGQILDKRLKFETLITRALREFMDAGSTGFDGCLYGINRELGKAIGADQSFVFQKRMGGFLIHKAYWSRNERPIYASTNQIQNLQNSGFNVAQLTRVLAINDTHKAKGFPCAAAFSDTDMRALMVVPIRSDTHDYGLLCLVQLGRPRVWTTAEISLMKTAADVIMSAHKRLHVETGLRENVRVLTEYDESLQELLAQKEAVAEAAQIFLRAGASRFTENVSVALKGIGRLLDADGIRVLVRDGEEDTSFYAWREEGLPYRFGYGQDSFDAALRNAADSLDEPAAINNMAETHPLNGLLHAGREEGLNSLLVVPARREDGLLGAIAFYKAIGSKVWSNADISSATAFFNVFLDAYRLKTESTACNAFDIRLHS